MAEDNTSRFRSSDPYGRGFAAAAAAPANDPLAELARLIGQTDPFAERRAPRQAEPDPAPHFGAAPVEQSYQANPPRYEAAPPYAHEQPPQYQPAPQYQPEQQYQPEPPRYAPDYPPRFDQAPQQDWSAPPQQDWAPPQQPYAPQPDLFGSAQQQQYAAYGAQQHPDVPYAQPQGRGMDYQAHVPGFDQPYQHQQPRSDYSQPLYPHESEAGSMPPPHDDEFYDDVPRGSRRRGLLTVAAVFALAIVGTAGAFGYRSLFGGPGVSGPPPVIRASGEPSKVAPPPQAPEQTAGKFSYDRFGDAGKDERVVRREENPVELAKPAPPPRTVLSGAPAANQGKPGAAMAFANPPSALGEPHRVRTVPIRPDQGDVAASSPVPTDAVSTAPPRQPVQQPMNRAAEADPAPAATPAVNSRAAASRPTRVAARPAPQPAPTQEPLANAPLSLAPDANNNPFPPPPTAAPSPRAAAPAAPPRAAAPARVASAPSSGAGSYLVQVSSQRSEADAQSSFQNIQQKYASVLGSQPHQIRKADLGSKGVYYRAMVGPFGSREQAVQLCSSLKQAGGDCVVQH